MKIAFIGQKGIPTKTGGVERQVEDLALNLVKAGHEVFVYARSSYNPEKLREWQGVKIITVPSVPSKNLDAITATFFACLDLIRRKYDVIHFQSIGPASMLWLAKIFNPRTPIVFTFHCQDYHHKKWGAFARTYLKFGERVGNLLADKVIITSHALLRYAKNKYHNDPVYIPSSAKLTELVAANEIKKWGLTKDNYIAYIGRLVRHKGVHFLIKAYQGVKTDKKLVIVGEGSYTDDYVKELHDLAGNNPNIIFTGNQSGSILKELFSNTAIFVQPSESEGLSFALLEGMAYARPCLVSDIEPNLEALADTGVAFKSGDYQDLQIKLQNMLDNQASLPTMGAAALERVKTEYDADNIAKHTADLYQEILK
jgi:glycosyltransferase involved in cell wall biosynthesis